MRSNLASRPSVRGQAHPAMVLALGVVVGVPWPGAQSNHDVGGDDAGTGGAARAEGVPEERQEQVRAAFAEANRSDGRMASSSRPRPETRSRWPWALPRRTRTGPGHTAQPGSSQSRPTKSFCRCSCARSCTAAGPGQIRTRRSAHRETLEAALAHRGDMRGRGRGGCCWYGRHCSPGPGRHEALVRPGGHQLVASKAGRTPATEQERFSPGERGRYELVLACRA